MGYGFRTTGKKVGWKNDIQGREKSYAAADWVSMPDRLIQAAERLRGVQIENKPAIEVMQRFNYKNVLIYIDPPYMLSTRHGKQYKHEMDTKDHEELLDVSKQHKGYVAISGYDTKLYNDTLQGWYKNEVDVRTMSLSKKREVLWTNYNPGGQMSLEDYPEAMP